MKLKKSKTYKKGFTLAEALTVLIAIGIVAAIAIPSIISNNREAGFKTGVKKAVETVSTAISLNIAHGERSALFTNENKTLFEYLQKNLNVSNSYETSMRNSANSEFYTSDGIRFEFPKDNGGSGEFDGVVLKDGSLSTDLPPKSYSCGTKGLSVQGNIKALSETPCVILADINGNKGPNILSSDEKLSDMFLIIVTDTSAFPYGVAAQKAYYGEK